MNITRNMSWIKKLAFLAIIWSVALLLVLAATELFLRMTSGGWDNTLRLNLIRSGTYNYPVSDFYKWPTPTVRYVRDRYGLRDDCASPAAIDILTVGGSTTDQRYLAQQSTYQAVMERELTRAAGRKVCVSNAGVDGHSTYGHLVAFHDWFPLIPGLKPKFFVFYIGVNDANFTRHGPMELENRAPDPNPLNRLKIVQLALRLREQVHSMLDPQLAYAAGHVRVDWQAANYSQERLAADTPVQAARKRPPFASGFADCSLMRTPTALRFCASLSRTGESAGSMGGSAGLRPSSAATPRTRPMAASTMIMRFSSSIE